MFIYNTWYLLFSESPTLGLKKYIFMSLIPHYINNTFMIEYVMIVSIIFKIILD